MSDLLNVKFLQYKLRCSREHTLHIINSRKNNYIDVIHIHNQQPENIQPNGLSVEYKNRFGNSVIMFKKKFPGENLI